MSPKNQPSHPLFRFRTNSGKPLTDVITHIETLATERLEAGIAAHSVRTGAQVLLQLAMEGVTVELVTPTETVPACPRTPKPSRCAEMEADR
jgi:hypothetical protein